MAKEPINSNDMKYKFMKNSDGVIKSVFIAYFILIFHVLLIALTGLLIFFFSGLVKYMFWIFLGGSALIVGTGYFFYRKVKAEKTSLREMLSLPVFEGRAVEVSFLGGFASLKMGQPNSGTQAIGMNSGGQLPAPGGNGSNHVKELTELAKLYEKNLITKAEYEKAKQQIFEASQTLNAEWTNTD